MIKSMTGYGRGEFAAENKTYIAEIKSVNHRYLDITVKTPKNLSFTEDMIKSIVKSKISRGKLDITITFNSTEQAGTDVAIDHQLAQKYAAELKKLAEEFPDLPMDLTIKNLSLMPNVINLIPAAEDLDVIKEQVASALSLAIDAFTSMREEEGIQLRNDILYRADIIEQSVNTVEEIAPTIEKIYYEKLKQRICELLDSNVEVPEEKIITEAAIFADKANITEEIVRLRSHIKQLRAFMNESDEPVGKKLDFLIQEMNRESNTIGSKANDIRITEQVLILKAEIEKIREQIQNIE